MSPAIAQLVIADGAASPANHNFDPVTTDGSLARYADRTASIPAGYDTISYEVLPPSGNRTTYKITASFYSPTIATVNGLDTVVWYQSGQVILNIHPNSTLAERKDLRAYVSNFFALATIKTSIENLEPIY